MKLSRRTSLALLTSAAIVTASVQSNNSARACTRAMYVGADNMVITGRSMDWNEDVYSNAWVFPRGMTRDGAAGSNSIKWTSKHGSLSCRATTQAPPTHE